MPREYRINRYIALCTGCSRRDADKYIADGYVKVDGKRLEDMSTKVTPTSKVFLRDKLLKFPRFSYYIFNKPAGYITTREDEKGRKTIYDILPKNMQEMKPVGRLDKDSSGLLILTNDGELINLMTHPKYKVPKKYKVSVQGKFTLNDAYNFRQGVDIGEAQPAKAEMISLEKTKRGLTEIILVLHQGYNRQIRRMVEKCGAEVVNLKRLSVGPVTLKNLKRNEFSAISQKEVASLYSYLEKKVKED